MSTERTAKRLPFDWLTPREELPHFTLRWRRLLRTPGRDTIFLLLFWLLTMLMLQSGTFDMWLYQLDRSGTLLGLLPALLVFCAHLGLLYAVAEAMRGIADERSGEAGWYGTLVDSRSALKGVLFSALLSGTGPAIALLGLYALLPMHSSRGLGSFNSMNYDPTANIMLDPGWADLPTVTLGVMFRLPAFALFAACLHLLLRGRWLSRVLSWLLASVGATLLCWTHLGFAMNNPNASHGIYGNGGFWFYLNPQPYSLEQIAPSLIVGTLLFLVLLWALRSWSRNPSSNWGPLLFSLSLLVITALTFIAVVIYVLHRHYFYSQSSPLWLQGFQLLSSPVTLPLHFALSCIFPTLSPVWCKEMSNSQLLFAANGIYSADARPWFWLPAMLFYCATTHALWHTALYCLRQARRGSA